MITETMRGTVAIIVMVGFLVFQVACDGREKTTTPAPGGVTDRPIKRFEFDSGDQLEKLINDLNYTTEVWQAGIREVPRLYITNILFPNRGSTLTVQRHGIWRLLAA